MTSHSTAIYTPFADGRTVRDIVEHSPALVTDAWCRRLLRQVLQSLEQQYASGAPHRPITPDSIVMLESGEALILPSSDTADAPAEAGIAADLHALALVIHYAISAELPPEGPLGPRLYDDYSDQLTQAIDRCLGPNQRLRPKRIADLRAMLGIEEETLVEPAAAPVEVEASHPEPAAMPVTADAVPLPAPSVQQVDITQAAMPQPSIADAHAAHALMPDEAPFASTADASGTAIEVHEAAAPARPAAQAHAYPEAEPAMTAAPTPAPERFGRPPLAATPLKPSSHPAPAATVTGTKASTNAAPRAPAPRARGGMERWAMLAGAAVVLLAAGGALYAHLDQDSAADMAALPQQQAARGLDAGESVLAPVAQVSAPVSAETAAGLAGDAPAGEPAPAGAGGAAPAANLPAVAHTPAAGAAGADAVVNGTTYKLLIRPWGTVYVNGVDRGVSPPVKRLTLGPGEHTIRIVNPNFAEHVMTVTAGGAESAVIEHDFTAPAEQGR